METPRTQTEDLYFTFAFEQGDKPVTPIPLGRGLDHRAYRKMVAEHSRLFLEQNPGIVGPFYGPTEDAVLGKFERARAAEYPVLSRIAEATAAAVGYVGKIFQ